MSVDLRTIVRELLATFMVGLQHRRDCCVLLMLFWCAMNFALESRRSAGTALTEPARLSYSRRV